MLTLYVLSCDKPELHKPELAIKSFGDTVGVLYQMTHRNIKDEPKVNPITTKWYGYIFSDEMLEEDAMNALPIYLEQGAFESLIIMKKEIIEGVPRITQAPRIFHKSIKLQDNVFLPEGECKFERMLDGWIIPNAENNIKL